MTVPATWSCPVCRGRTGEQHWSVPADGSESGVDARSFRPSSELFGHTAASVVRCASCGHGSLADPPRPETVSDAYSNAADPVSLRESEGQIETARRAFASIERFIRPGLVCDVGCWTGSLLVAAAERGWQTVGVEPSAWAADVARGRGLNVRTAELADAGLAPGSCRLVTTSDVLEHLTDPGAAMAEIARLLQANGGIYLTVPDAGSRLARLMGRRWWSVLPMHVQYFTRSSMLRLLEDHGFQVRAVATHAKVFSLRYYAERLGGYSVALEDMAVRAIEAMHWEGRQVAPDFRDRMAVIATLR